MTWMTRIYSGRTITTISSSNPRSSSPIHVRRSARSSLAGLTDDGFAGAHDVEDTGVPNPVPARGLSEPDPHRHVMAHTIGDGALSARLDPDTSQPKISYRRHMVRRPGCCVEATLYVGHLAPDRNLWSHTANRVSAGPMASTLARCTASAPVSYTHLTLPTIYSV